MPLLSYVFCLSGFAVLSKNLFFAVDPNTSLHAAGCAPEYPYWKKT
jgi:hypothetical protein